MPLERLVGSAIMDVPQPLPPPLLPRRRHCCPRPRPTTPTCSATSTSGRLSWLALTTSRSLMTDSPSSALADMPALRMLARICSASWMRCWRVAGGCAEVKRTKKSRSEACRVQHAG